MGRTPCCAKVGVNRGAWSAQEDRVLTAYVAANGEGKWNSLPQKAGLNRCGKSCRLRWMNYLKPGIKRGGFTQEEDDILIKLHNLLGNRWALIAGRLPSRTDNEIKNYWNTTLSKKAKNSNNTNHGRCTLRPRSADDRRRDGDHVVHYAKAFRCKKVVLPASLLRNAVNKDEEDMVGMVPCNAMMSENGAGDGLLTSGGRRSSLFSFSDGDESCADLLLSEDFEGMADWCALEKMASFLDLEADEWN